MRITLDDVVTEEQPTSVNWGNPRLLGHEGSLGGPIYGPYRSCGLGFDRLTTVEYYQWWAASEDGVQHQVRLPHPQSGVPTEYTCWVNKFAPRMNARGECEGAAAGVDIRLTRIFVT